MASPEYVRVRYENGAEKSVPARRAKILGLTVIDGPALGNDGRPLAMTRAALDEAPDTAYAGQKVAELKAEIERRNEGRDEADLIPSDGKKADLVAALEADDGK